MDRQEIFSGKTVEEAVETGLNALGVTREEAEITVLEEGRKKLFGSVPASVKITVKDNRTDGERAVDFLKGLFEKLSSDVVPVLSSEDEKIEINLRSESARGLIGRRGEVIDAIQILAGAVANTGRRDYRRVVVDCENYREDRESTLRRVAEKLAAKAVKLGKKVRLEPMNPYERRIIHAALSENTEVTTKSEGKEPARFVVIIPKNLRSYDRKDGNRGGREFNRDKRGGFNRDRNGRSGNYGERKPYPKRELPSEETPQSSGTSLKRDGSSGSGYKKGGFSGFFGTYLGNSRGNETETPDQPTSETEE